MFFLDKISVIVLGFSFLPLTIPFKINLQKTCPHNMAPINDKTCMDIYEWPNKKGGYPLVGASGLPEPRDEKTNQMWDAQSLCKSVGKRVCWDNEWITACKGKNNAKYPWGNTVPMYIPGEFDSHLACNFGKKYIGVDEKKIYMRDKHEMARLDMREPSGSRQECKSATGIFDMTGNVEEWVRCKGKTGWCLAGRYWSELRECTRVVQDHAPKWHYYQTGFL